MSAGRAARPGRRVRRRPAEERRPRARTALEPGEGGAASRVGRRPPRRAPGRRAASRRAARPPAAGTGAAGRAQTAIAGSSSRFVRARIARVASSSRPGVERPGRSGRSRRTSRAARTIGPAASGPARIVFANRSRLCSTSRTARSTTVARAAVVHHEVDPAEARQRVGEAEDAPDVGESPAVDRLVVVADEEDPVRRRREEQRQPELGPVEVLGLVDEEMRAAAPATAPGPPAPPRGARAPGRRGRRSRARRRRRSPARRRRTPARSGPAPGRRRPRPRSRRCRASGARSPCRAVASRPARPPAGAAAGSPSGRRAARPAAPASRRISRPERVERPDPDGARRRRRADRGRPPSRSVSSSAARLLNVIAAISSGGAAPDAMSQATRATSVVVLPLPAGRDAEQRPGRCGRGRPLVRSEPGQPGLDRRIHPTDHVDRRFLRGHRRLRGSFTLRSSGLSDRVIERYRSPSTMIRAASRTARKRARQRSPARVEVPRGARPSPVPGPADPRCPCVQPGAGRFSRRRPRVRPVRDVQRVAQPQRRGPARRRPVDAGQRAGGGGRRDHPARSGPTCC